jgi:hypothetical protein
MIVLLFLQNVCLVSYIAPLASALVRSHQQL